MWNSGWDDVFNKSDWGKYPGEDLIRFIARNFYKVPDRSKVDILEVGSGTGANLWYMAREGFNVTGIDGSQVGIEKSKKRLEQESLNVTHVVGDIINLPFEDDQFNCVVDNECLYANSFKDTKKILKEIKRVIKKDGLFYSRCFMTGTYGDGNGKKLEGEKNTYVETYEGALRKDYGLIRYTDEEEIPELYGTFFTIESSDYLIRSINSGKQEIKEWIIICKNEKK